MKTMALTLNVGFGLTASGLTGLVRTSRASVELEDFLKGAGDLDKYAGKLADNGFAEVDSLADREVSCLYGEHLKFPCGIPFFLFIVLMLGS